MLASVSASAAREGESRVAAMSLVVTTDEPSPIVLMSNPAALLACFHVLHAVTMSVAVLPLAFVIVSATAATEKPSAPATVPAVTATLGRLPTGPEKLMLTPLASPSVTGPVTLTGARARLMLTSCSL